MAIGSLWHSLVIHTYSMYKITNYIMFTTLNWIAKDSWVSLTIILLYEIHLIQFNWKKVAQMIWNELA